MAFRVVLIENEVGMYLKLNNLVVRKDGEDTWIPLDDISIVILDNLSISITSRIMCQLAENGIGLVICNPEHLPIGFFSSYDNHSRASKILKFQLYKEQNFYDNLWLDIVYAKVCNQAKAYMSLKDDKDGMNKILDFSKSIKPGDPSNREAHAAKVYFNQLMGSSFSRGNENILLNSALNYGYSIIRAYIARICVGYGLNTQIGIHHKNEYNRFNLVDDLMEPVRPFVDVIAYKLLENEKYFKPEHRHKLVDILNVKVQYRNKNMYFANMLDDYIEQIAAVYMERKSEIIYPDIDGFGEEKDEI